MRKGEILLRFGSAVRMMRSQLGISQEELAGRADLHRTYISDIERGARNVSLESIEKLAQALDTSISSLFFLASGEKPAAGLDLKQPGAPDALVDILLVEDDPRDAELTLEAFNRARITNSIHVARDGAEALDYVFSSGPYKGRRVGQRLQVILLDLNLPKVSGLEVLRQLKEDPRTRTIPVVVLTESQNSRDMAQCRQLGAQNCIIKPVDFHRFSQVMPQMSFRWALLRPSSRVSA